MTDAILKSTAIEKSYDNLTVVMVAFKNLHSFYENHGINKPKTQIIKIEGESPDQPESGSRLGLHSSLPKSSEGYQTSKSKKPKNLISSSLGFDSSKHG